MTTLHFVNHASYLQRSGGIRLLVDPWTTGDAFHHGWSLLAPTQTSDDVLTTPTHIWLSHEHPDHFTPAFFRTIPKETRKDITVLYQKTKDRKVVEFLAKQGFQTRELESGVVSTLEPGFDVMCEAVPVGDSFLVTRDRDTTIVNMNDCTHLTKADLRKVRERFPRIDVLFTQFGYASWQGAPEETALRKQLARAQFDRITRQVEVFEPTYVVPFASFIYFSAKENSYLNDANNTVQEAYAHIEKLGGPKPIVMFPADEWSVGQPWDNKTALERWAKCYELPTARYEAESVPVDELKKLGDAYTKRMFEFHSPRMIKTFGAVPALGLFGPIVIYLSDHERAVRFGLQNGLETVDVPQAQADITMHSESLQFLLKFDYGLNTLSVNGRFVTDNRGFKRLVRTFGLGSLKNDGRRFAPQLLADKTLWRGATRAFFQRKE